MKIGRVLILLALILLFAVLALVFWMKRNAAPKPNAGVSGGGKAAQQVQTVKVVVAAQPIKRGTKITENMLTEVELPADKVIASQVTNPKQVIGKRAVRDLPQGMFLTKADVAEKLSVSSEGSLAALQIAPGSVAISIPMDRLSGVAYAVRPGDHVAIIASFPFVDVDPDFQSVLPDKVGVVYPPQTSEKGQTLTAGIEASDVYLGHGTEDEKLGVPFYLIPSEPQRPRLVTQMIIPNAAVLYVGEFPLGQKKKQEEETPNGGKPGAKPRPTPPPQARGQVEEENSEEMRASNKPDIVTLIVSPQDAVTLKYLLDRHVSLTLALRAADDNAQISTDAVTLSYIMGKYGVVQPARLPYDLEPAVGKMPQSQKSPEAAQAPQER